MAQFVVSHDSPLSPADAWARVTNWPEHGKYVPLTSITVTPPGPSAVGTVFTARTAVGRFGFDDPMEIVEWSPPVDGSAGSCRLEKRGRVMLGWAELSVQAQGSGSRTTWREDVRPAKAPRFVDGPSAASAKLLFGRVLRKLIDS